MAPAVPRRVVKDLLRLVRAVFCSSSVDLQHSVVRVLFSPSAMLDFSPSRERESWAWKLDLPIIPGVTHKERIPWPFPHHVPLHKMLKTDLVSVRLRLGQEGDFVAIHRFDIPRHTGDQWGYVNGAFTRNHLLPVSEHGSDWRAADLFCHGVHVLQLGQATEAEVCTRVHDHGEPLG